MRHRNDKTFWRPFLLLFMVKKEEL